MVPMEVQADSILKVCDGLEKTEVPDGFVIFKADTEKVHYLNPSAAVIFELCDGRKNLADIAAFMREAYDLRDSPLKETLACANGMVGQGLLLPCPK